MHFTSNTYSHHLHFLLEYCPLHSTPSLHYLHNFWFEYWPLHPTPIHTTFISVSGIALCTQPLFIPLTFLSWVLPSTLITLYTLINFWRALPTTSNPSLHRLQFWLEYCPLHPTPLNNTYISDSSTALCIWHSRDENGSDKFFKFGEIWVFLYYCPEGFPWNPSCWSSSVLLKRNEECDYR